METADNSLRLAAELLSASFKHPGAVQKAALAYLATFKYVDAFEKCPGSKMIYAMAEMAYDRACKLSEGIPKEEPTGLTISQILEQDYHARTELTNKADQLSRRILNSIKSMNKFRGVQIYPSKELSPFSMALQRTADGLQSLIEKASLLNSDLTKILSNDEGKALAERNREYFESLLEAYRGTK